MPKSGGTCPESGGTSTQSGGTSPETGGRPPSLESRHPWPLGPWAPLGTPGPGPRPGKSSHENLGFGSEIRVRGLALKSGPAASKSGRQPQSLAWQLQSLARQPQSQARQPQSLARQPQSLAWQPQSVAQQDLWRQQSHRRRSVAAAVARLTTGFHGKGPRGSHTGALGCMGSKIQKQVKS